MANITKVFNSVTEFAAYLDKGETQPNFLAKSKLSTSESEKETEFTGTKSFAEAQGLMINGDIDNFKKLQAAGMKERVNASNTATGRVLRPAVCGAAVNVPAYLSGRPNCMIQQRTIHRKAKVLNVIFGNMVPWYIKTDEIINKSILVLQALKDLEKQGVRVNLYVYTGTEKKRDHVETFIKIKDAGQYADFLKMTYFIVNPSFLRRQWFRFCEITPKVGKAFVETYGHCVFMNRMKQAAKEQKIEGVFFGLNELIESKDKAQEMINNALKEYRPQ